VLIYPSAGERPKARRLLTETTDTQGRPTAIFDPKPLGTPRLGHTPRPPTNTALTSGTIFKIN